MKAVIAILCITLLEVFALANGINGTLYSLVIATLAALAGANLPKNIRQKIGVNE